MVGSAVLDLILGLSFLLFVLSTAVTAGVELARGAVNSRGRTLFRSIGEMLDGTPHPGEHSRTSQLYASPYIQGEMTSRQRGEVGRRPTTVTGRAQRSNVESLRFQGPKRIEPSTFGAAYMWVQNTEQGGGGAPSSTGDGPVQTAEQAEAMFSQRMAQVSESYRTRSRGWLFLGGLVFAILLNIDVIAVAQTLWADESVRAAVVEVAAQCEGVDCVTARAEIEALPLPIGWKCGKEERECSFSEGILESSSGAFFGFALTGAAVAMGAPVWYDVARLLPGRRRERG